jgi:uncharacterized protein
MRLTILLTALALALPAQAQNKFGQPEVPPGADPSLFQPLPERKDVVSWRTLAQVELVRAKDRYIAQFSDNVTVLDRKEVKLQGFMMPLQTGDRQTHFVLSATPQSCSFCLPGGPESLVEVKARKPVKYTFEPLVMSGKLEVLKDDPSGVFYRLIEAVQAN